MGRGANSSRWEHSLLPTGQGGTEIPPRRAGTHLPLLPPGHSQGHACGAGLRGGGLDLAMVGRAGQPGRPVEQLPTARVQSCPGVGLYQRCCKRAVRHAWRWTWSQGSCQQERLLIGTTEPANCTSRAPPWLFWRRARPRACRGQVGGRRDGTPWVARGVCFGPLLATWTHTCVCWRRTRQPSRTWPLPRTEQPLPPHGVLPQRRLRLCPQVRSSGGRQDSAEASPRSPGSEPH